MSEECCEKSLEVVDTESTYTCECGFSSDTAEAMLVHSCDPYKKHVEEEPLVRLSDVIEFIRHRIEKVEETDARKHLSEEAKDDPLMPHIADALTQTRHHELLRIEKKLEEFTQGESGE